jgi:hypothetical protein
MSKKLKIAIFTEEKEYGKALAKGLCIQSSGLEILLADSLEEAKKYVGDIGIILTDVSNFQGENVAFIDNVALPTDEILKIIAKVYFQLTSENFNPKITDEENLKVWSFGSLVGGSGVTSCAIVASRMLAAENNQVLYMNWSLYDDYEIYCQGNFDDIFPKGKLIYAAKTNSKILLDNCFSKDSYGVWHLKPSENINELFEFEDGKRLLEFLEKEKRFSHIILDLGKVSKDYQPISDVTVEVANFKDLRCSVASSWANWVIVNFSNAQRDRGDNKEIHIVKDDICFRQESGKIKISDESKFVDGVSLLVKALSVSDDYLSIS